MKKEKPYPETIDCQCGFIAKKILVQVYNADRINVIYVCQNMDCGIRITRKYFTESYTGVYN